MPFWTQFSLVSSNLASWNNLFINLLLWRLKSSLCLAKVSQILLLSPILWFLWLHIIRIISIIEIISHVILILCIICIVYLLIVIGFFIWVVDKLCVICVLSIIKIINIISILGIFSIICLIWEFWSLELVLIWYFLGVDLLGLKYLGFIFIISSVGPNIVLITHSTDRPTHQNADQEEHLNIDWWVFHEVGNINM